MEKNPEYIPRVNHIDALYLDNEIKKILRQQFVSALQIFSPVLLSRFQPEVDLFVDSVFWLGSLGRKMSTFGHQLFLISYNKEIMTNYKLAAHFLLQNLLKYGKNFVEQRFPEAAKTQATMQMLEISVQIATIANFFRFLKTGSMPTLTDYVLNLNYISNKSADRRQIGYDHMNRELLWGGFMELLGIILPFVNYHKLSRQFKLAFNAFEKYNTKERIIIDRNSLCTFCGCRPVLPHEIGCSHIYCYYCVQGNYDADQGFVCRLCGAKVSWIKPIRIAR